MAKKSFSNQCEDIYENGGQSAVFDFINKQSKKKLKELRVEWEYCKACECESPAQDHNCLVCGQGTQEILIAEKTEKLK